MHIRLIHLVFWTDDGDNNGGDGDLSDGGDEYCHGGDTDPNVIIFLSLLQVL